MAEVRGRKAGRRSGPLLGALLLGMSLPGLAAGEDTPEVFEKALVHFEQNATDGDVEVVFKVTGDDDGLAELSVVGPDGRKVVDFRASDPSTLGIRSFVFESPEPKDVAGLKAAYPEGVYRFEGATADGERFRGKSTLSHALPTPVTFVHPKPGEQFVQALGLEIRWRSGAKAAGYIVEIEQEELGVDLSVTLPASAFTFTVPNDFLRPGTEYTLGIGAFTEDGNVSFVETSFETSQIE